MWSDYQQRTCLLEEIEESESVGFKIYLCGSEYSDSVPQSSEEFEEVKYW